MVGSALPWIESMYLRSCFSCPWFSDARQTCIIEKPTNDMYIPSECVRWKE